MTLAEGLTTPQYERTQYVRCNTIGHAWDDVDSNHWKAPWGDPLTLRCERCSTERRECLDPGGNLIPGSRRYLYPTGYKYAKGTRPTRSAFRRMLLETRIREARAARKKK